MSANAQSEGDSVGRRDRRHADRSRGRSRHPAAGPARRALVLGVRPPPAARWRLDTAPAPATGPAAVPPPPGPRRCRLRASRPGAPPGDRPTRTSPAGTPRAGPASRDRDLGRHVRALVTSRTGRPVSSRATRRRDSGLDDEAARPRRRRSRPSVRTMSSPPVVDRGRPPGRPGRRWRPVPGEPAEGRLPPAPTWSRWPRATARALEARDAAGPRSPTTPPCSPGRRSTRAGPRPTSPTSFAPITALWVDDAARLRVRPRHDPRPSPPSPSPHALRRAGIRVRRPAAAQAGRRMTELARVSSAPLAQIVEKVLSVSDNEGAEVLARHVGLATAGVGSFEAGRAECANSRRGLASDSPAPRSYDGSGLSRHDRLTRPPWSTCCAGRQPRPPEPPSGAHRACRWPASPGPCRAASTDADRAAACPGQDRHPQRVSAPWPA